MRPHRWINVLVGLAISMSIALSLPPAAHAATCSGYGCDGKDPYATGCAGYGASYRVVAMRWIYDKTPDNQNWNTIGYVQLWWSATCGTNWARTVRIVPGSYYYLSADIYRDSNRNGRYDWWETHYYVPFTLGVTTVYTKMVYGYGIPAQACGELDPNAIYFFRACTTWV